MGLFLLFFFLFQTPQEPKFAALEGKVLHAGSQATLRKAKVTLTALSADGAKVTAETGDDGKYFFKDVKPGRYRLMAEKAGYQASAYGAPKAGQTMGQALRVDAGASLTGLDISVPKYGMIAGRIQDFDSEPVSKALVMALTDTFVSGRKMRLPRGTMPAMSNDLGEFRIGELPPGKYIVCAVPVGWYQPDPQSEVKPAVEDGVATTCLPGVPRMEEATTLEIQDGTEIPGMNIRLNKTKAVTVQGQVSGVPAGAGGVTILNLTTKGFGPIGNAMFPRAYIRGSDGKFDFRSVPPGSYILHSLPTGLGNAAYAVRSNIEVGDQPVKELSVPALIPFELKAKVIAEPGPELKLPSIRIILSGVDDITPVLAMGTANADGDVVVANVTAGRHRLNVTGIPSTHYLCEIRLGEEVVPSEDLEIQNAGAPMTVRLALGKASLVGQVLNDKGDPAPGVTVSLLPRPKRLLPFRFTSTDQSGIFRLQNVAPAEYLLLAMETQEPSALENEEFLKPFLAKAKKLKVDEGSSQKVELRLIPLPAN